MDADDVIAEHRIEYLVNYCKKYPRCIVFDDIEECHDTHSGLFHIVVCTAMLHSESLAKIMPNDLFHCWNLYLPGGYW